MHKKLDHIHKEKGENLHLRQHLEHNNKIIEQLQKSTKTVYVAKEKPFTKDKDPIISDWLEDAREHLVTIPDEKSRIDFLMQNLIL
jgi:nucleoid-associated protein YejK